MLHDALGSIEGFQSVVHDTPIYSRLLLRFVPGSPPVTERSRFLYDYDNGNGVFYNNDV